MPELTLFSCAQRSVAGGNRQLIQSLIKGVPQYFAWGDNNRGLIEGLGINKGHEVGGFINRLLYIVIDTASLTVLQTCLQPGCFLGMDWWWPAPQIVA